MSTGSILEMFLTTFGWHLYNIVWGVISSTGLALLPIFAAIIDNVIKPVESQEAKAAAATSLRRLEIDIIRIIVLMMLSVSPSISLHFGAVTTAHACTGQTNSAGDSGSYLDRVFNPQLLDNEEVKIPPWFYIVMSVSGGINEAIINRLPCEINMRQTAHEVNTAVITDDHLKKETRRFVAECYKPGVADYFNQRKKAPENKEDMLWLGGKYFVDGFYRSEYAKSPVQGFAFDASRESDKGHQAEGSTTPENGYPSCYEWWADERQGLRSRLVKVFPPSLYQRVNYIVQPDQLRRVEDSVLAKVLRDELALDVTGDSQTWDRNDKGSMLVDYIAGLFALGGGVIADMLIQPVIYSVIQGAPIAQSVLLMATYFLLPWVLLVGNYEWSSIRTASVTIFAIKFWTSIWAVLSLLDNQLMKVVRDASGNTGLLALTNDMIFTKVLFDLTMLTMYIGLPAYFLSILSWGGERNSMVANGAASEMSSSGAKAGSKGASMAEQGVKSKLGK